MLQTLVGNWPLITAGAVAGIGGIWVILKMWKKYNENQAGVITAGGYISGKQDADIATKEIQDAVDLAKKNPNPDFSTWGD